MFKNTLFAVLCMAAAANAAAHVYKSVSQDGKIMYSDHPSDHGIAQVSVIKADVVQVVSAAPAPSVDEGTKKLCTKMVHVVIGPNGDILRVLPFRAGLAAKP